MIAPLARDRPEIDNRKSDIRHGLRRKFSHHARPHPGTRHHAARIRKNKTVARRTRALAHRTRHFQRDVERALLLQVFPRSPEAPAHAQQVGCARARRECRHHRHRRRVGVRVQNRIAQSSIVYRAISGRRHRRRRHPARHFYHGRAARGRHGFTPLRSDYGTSRDDPARKF